MDQLVVDLREGDSIICGLFQVRETNVVLRETVHPLLYGALCFRALEDMRREKADDWGGITYPCQVIASNTFPNTHTHTPTHCK